jgi:hypothetical protein
MVGLQEVLQVVQAKTQAKLTDSAVTEITVTHSAITDRALMDSAVTEQLDEQIQALQDTLVQYTPS